MPLKLLGKKSWHVYNADNVARVRRDEAAAEAQEEEEERQRRERESDRRAALLRGEVLPDDDDDEQKQWKNAASALSARGEQKDEPASVPRHARTPRRPRKRHGEDDTDFEMRLAREQREQADSRKDKGHHKLKRREKEPALVDSAGHIDLFGQAPAAAAPLGPPPADTDGPSMRFADAGGRGGFGTWYTGQGPPKRSFTSSSSRPDLRPPRPPIAAPAGSIGADPLAAMKQATAAMRALKKERQREDEERRQAMADLISEHKSEHKSEQARGRHGDHGDDERRHRDSSRDRDRRRDHRRSEHGHHRHHTDYRDHRDRYRLRDDGHRDRSRDHKDPSRSGRHAERDRHSSHRTRSRSPRSK